jgi:hypothetical protein
MAEAEIPENWVMNISISRGEVALHEITANKMPADNAVRNSYEAKGEGQDRWRPAWHDQSGSGDIMRPSHELPAEVENRPRTF